MNDTATTTRDALDAIAHARVTGSVGCTYNDTTAQRLYTSSGGIGATYEATNVWLITHPDGTTVVVEHP